jgi:hypothetical protein
LSLRLGAAQLIRLASTQAIVGACEVTALGLLLRSRSSPAAAWNKT